jgi:hypothetical protein
MKLAAVERQQHFIQLASVHAEDFKTRVAQHDRENSFPFERGSSWTRPAANDSKPSTRWP